MQTDPSVRPAPGVKLAPENAVFISYRRIDSIHAVDRLDDALKRAFGVSAVFRDRSSLPVGREFPEEIKRALEQARVGVVVIGPAWAGIQGRGPRRIDGSDDWVRREVAALLDRRDETGRPVPVIPVYTAGVQCLKESDLPEVLHSLARREMREFCPEPDTEASIGRIVEAIGALLQCEPMPWRPITERVNPARVSPTRLTVIGEKFVGRGAEMHLLDEAWGRRAPTKVNVVTLVGQGGEGKTSLVLNWYANRARQGWCGATDVFDWSFYSGGAGEGKGGDADLFFAKAYEWYFGPAEPVPRESWQKGARLAERIASQRSLFVLDGLESLQNSPAESGTLKDAALQVLLRALAMNNGGLCVVTSRAPVVELARFENEQGSCWCQFLAALDDAAARELLRALGVTGTDPELLEAIHDLGNHAYSLNLLGNFLHHCTRDRSIRRWRKIGLPAADVMMNGKPLRVRGWRRRLLNWVRTYFRKAPLVTEGHGWRIMRGYEDWLGERSSALLLLRMLGLFDRPVPLALVEALCCPPSIPQLTDGPALRDGPALTVGLDLLVKLRLVTAERTSTSTRRSAEIRIDTHPLVRDYFAAELLKDRLSWEAAHDRVYDWLTRAVEERPGTLIGLQPLYQAIRHGCQAGREHDAFKTVLVGRILRQTNGPNAKFATRILGAWNSQLAAVENFFEGDWSRPTQRLHEEDQSWLQNEAGNCLRALGRIQEAKRPLQLAFEGRTRRGRSDQASVTAMVLAEIHLVSAEFSEAVQFAREAVNLCRLAPDYRLRDALALSAYIEYERGERALATERFRDAEVCGAMLRHRTPPKERPLLYGLQGFFYANFLLAPLEREAWLHFELRREGRGVGCADRGAFRRIAESVRQRVRQSREIIVSDYRDPLHLALDELCEVRIDLYEALLDAAVDPEVFEKLRDRVTAACGDVHESPHLPRMLLTKSWLECLANAEGAASATLEETHARAERDSMRLHLADVLLHRGRLFRQRADLRGARDLIRTIGYGRRMIELTDAERFAVQHHWAG